MGGALKVNLVRRLGKRRWIRYTVLVAAPAAAAALTISTVSQASSVSPAARLAASVPVPKTLPAYLYHSPQTKTPIQHLVVLFDENVSFDHYFGTYPHAANTDGSPFHAKPGTPKVKGLTPALLQHNPNEYNPERLTPSEALTCDQNHDYTPEQLAFNDGKMNEFVQNTSVDTCTGEPILYGAPGLGMDYYDGNTVTALWNYAQNYAMSDNNYDTDFGPSTPGALNLASGDDGGGYTVNPTTGAKESDPGTVGSVGRNGIGTIYGDVDPAYDDCSDTNHTSDNPVGVMTGRNIGNLLNAQHITWGWFQGGFAPTGTSNGYRECNQEMENIGGIEVTSYVPHHDPFQFYKSTANPRHLPPTSEAAIGRTDQANHQYDLSLFYETLKDGNLPAVSFLKAPAAENGHPGYSDPIDEQHFIVNTVNAIEKSKFWPSTAIVITYDDSDGWYDQQASPIVSGSHDPSVDTPMCESHPIGVGYRDDRCGFGPRLPLVVISPWTRDNYVSHNLTNQASIIAFIEDNWLNGERIGGGSYDAISGSLDAPGGVLNFQAKPHLTPVILNPKTGEVVSGG